VAQAETAWRPLKPPSSAARAWCSLLATAMRSNRSQPTSGGHGGQVAICAADVSRQEDVEQIGRVALERFGGFDSWVNDAATATYGRMDQVTLEDHRRIFDVNYHGLLMGSLVAARHLRQRGGAIINVGSVLSDRAMIYQGPYSCTSAARPIA
jgi:NAD(P)-dependent dehydrogenase (short-subunit alcohol dehydrogenase family)